MSNFAYWTTLNYVNDTTPAINETNLNKNENALENIMDELNYSKGYAFDYVKKYAFYNNILQINDSSNNSILENVSLWSSIGTSSISQEYSVPVGVSGVKCEETDNTSSTIGIESSSIPSTNMVLSSRDSTDEVIIVMIYLSDASQFINNVIIKFGDDDSNYMYFETDVTGLDDGWNLITLYKADATETGSVTSAFENVSYISITVETNSSADGEYFVVPGIWVTQKDELSNTSNPFYYTDGNSSYTELPYIQNTDITSLVLYDVYSNNIGWQLLEDLTFPTMNEVLCSINSFFIKSEAICKNASYGLAIEWYADSNNYLVVGVDSDAFYLYENVGGSGSIVSIQSVTLPYGGRHELEVEKVEDLIRAKLIIDGDGVYYIDYETTIASNTAGCVGFTKTDSSSYYFITDYVISHNRAILPTYKGCSKILLKVKQEDQDDSTTTLGNDDELFIYLPPNSLYEVLLVLIVDGVDDSSDIKVDWSYTGMNYVTRKCSRGIGTSSTSVDNSDSMNNQAKAATSQNEFGVVTSGWNYISEVCIFKVGETGATLNIQHAKVNSTANNITIKESSYIKATRID